MSKQKGTSQVVCIDYFQNKNTKVVTEYNNKYGLITENQKQKVLQNASFPKYSSTTKNT